MAQCILRIQSRHIISLKKVNFPFLLIQTGARKDSSICEKTQDARDAKKCYDNPLVLHFEALVSHNLAASQFIASIMGRCLLAVKQLLAKAVIKVQSSNINGHHVSAFDRITANSRCVTVLSSCHALPQSADLHILRLNTGLAVDFPKIAKVPSLSFWDPWSFKLLKWLESSTLTLFFRPSGEAVIRGISDPNLAE